MVKCVKCKGAGFVTVQIKQNVGHGFLVQTVRSHCDECRDGYKQNSSKCDKCNNMGKTHVEKKIEINNDKGVGTGKSYLRDNVIDDAVLMFIELEPNFEIVQNNIIFRQKIAFVDTIFGTTLVFKHPSGQ
jgi:DnaJ-class molecular chaperone